MLASISSEFQKSHQASWLGTSCVRNCSCDFLIWIGIRYLLATCTFTPLYGRLCDVMGRKNANHTALFFAGSGILLCGFSRSMEMLILSRFVSYLNVILMSPDALPVVRNWWRRTNDDFFVCLLSSSWQVAYLNLNCAESLSVICIASAYRLSIFPFWFLLTTWIQSRGLAQGVASVFNGVSAQVFAIAIKWPSVHGFSLVWGSVDLSVVW